MHLGILNIRNSFLNYGEKKVKNNRTDCSQQKSLLICLFYGFVVIPRLSQHTSKKDIVNQVKSDHHFSLGFIHFDESTVRIKF